MLFDRHNSNYIQQLLVTYSNAVFLGRLSDHNNAIIAISNLRLPHGELSFCTPITKIGKAVKEHSMFKWVLSIKCYFLSWLKLYLNPKNSVIVVYQQKHCMQNQHGTNWCPTNTNTHQSVVAVLGKGSISLPSVPFCQT